MSDSETLEKILHWANYTAIRQIELVEMAFIRFWEQEMAKPRNADPKRLLRYGFKLYSQNDEDGIIQEIFQRIGSPHRTFVEFGVQNGFECNSAKLLIEGWHGLWIEANTRSVGEIRKNFGAFFANGQLKLTHSMVTAENINALLGDTGMTGEIDMLCIDIDFNDYWVWKAIDIVRPHIVVIEYNTSFRPPLSIVVPYDPQFVWTGSNYGGASLAALVKLGKAKGYRIVGCCFAGVNAFFVRDDLCGDHFVEPATAEEHYEPDRYFTRKMPSGLAGKPGPFVTV